MPLSKKSGKFWEICKMSDQSGYLVSKRSRRMLGRHASSLKGNFKMNFHIGGFFAKFLFFAQQYTSGKTQLFPSKFGLLRFCWEGSFNVRIWSASWSMTVHDTISFCTFSFQQEIQSFFAVSNKPTNPLSPAYAFWASLKFVFLVIIFARFWGGYCCGCRIARVFLKERSMMVLIFFVTWLNSFSKV